MGSTRLEQLQFEMIISVLPHKTYESEIVYRVIMTDSKHEKLDAV